MTMMQMFSVLAGMEAVQRYSMTKLAVPENVLSHTAMTAIFCMLIGDELNSIKHTVDVEIVLRSALVHDMEEIFTGDIARPIKYDSHDTRVMFDEIKDTAMQKVVKQLDASTGIYYAELHKCAKDLKTVEGIVVAIADMLCVAFKVWDEVIVRNNLSLMRVINVKRWNLDGLHHAIHHPEFSIDQIYFLRNILGEIATIARMAETKLGALQIGQLEEAQ